MSAGEALRRARATMECGVAERAPLASCQFMTGGDQFEIWSVECEPQLSWSNAVVHRATASALLDGFSVREVTKAGG